MYWQQEAACRTADSEMLFADTAALGRAKALCARCPVRTECLAEALDNRIEFGVWGGMTARERGALLRRRPGVASWQEVLTQADRGHPLQHTN
jgi:WhiB family redox-sensing transcriptional regulator